MAFINYGQKVYDFGTNSLAYNCLGWKKKRLVKMLSQPLDDIIDTLTRAVRYNGHSLDLDNYIDALLAAYYYKDAWHFYVPSCKDHCRKEYTSYLLLDNNAANVMVESETSAYHLFSHLYKLENSVEIGEHVLCSHAINVFVKSKNGYLYKPFESISFLTVYITDDKNYIVTIPKHNVALLRSVSTVNTKVVARDMDYSCTVKVLNTNEIESEDNNSTVLTVARDSLDAVSYALYCYHNRGQIINKRKKIAREYNENKVHTVHTVHQYSGSYRLLDLDMYVKEYEPSTYSEYKGGHHASPVAHDRRSYYRRSRGKGDYDLVDGEFIKVDKGQGHYSLVRATRVNPSDNNVTVIYKTKKDL